MDFKDLNAGGRNLFGSKDRIHAGFWSTTGLQGQVDRQGGARAESTMQLYRKIGMLLDYLDCSTTVYWNQINSSMIMVGKEPPVEDY